MHRAPTQGLSVRLDADGAERPVQSVVAGGYGDVSELPAALGPGLGQSELQLLVLHPQPGELLAVVVLRRHRL